MRRTLLPLLAVLAVAVPGAAGETAAGATVLVSPLRSSSTYLMDQDGQLVHEWKADAAPGNAAYLLENGHLLRSAYVASSVFSGGGQGGRIEEFDWDGQRLWQFDYATPLAHLHHDVKPMPNGNVLAIAWEAHSAAEAAATGRTSASIPATGVWADAVIEIEPASGRVVWVWHLWDHLLAPGGDPAAHPELVDPNAFANASSPDWTHVNAIDYEPTLDQVLLSVRNHSEIWILDHGTSSDEARGHSGGRRGRGGDLLYRWGNPSAWGASGERQLYAQHGARWVPADRPGAGHIVIFDNGDPRLRAWSRVVEIAPALLPDGSYARAAGTAFGPTAPDWQWTGNPPQSFYATHLSSAQRLPSGNTLVCDGPAGRLFELEPAGTVVWQQTLTSTAGSTGIETFRADRYELSFPGLAGRDLTPQGPLRVRLDARN